MADEEEAMELSGESNIVTNLHNFSFDVSLSKQTGCLETPMLQPRVSQLISPARFVSASTPNPCSWKSLTMKERSSPHLYSPTVKVSQKTVASYHRDGQQLDSPQPCLSPMEVDTSESSFVLDQPKSKVTKRSSDFGVSYYTGNPIETPKMKDISELTPIRRRHTDRGLKHDSSLEDSVFFRDSKLVDTSKSDIQQRQNAKYTRRSKTISNSPDNSWKSTLLVILLIGAISCCVGTYLYFQIGWCAVFDVDTVKLGHKLEDNVFGQHIAVKTIIEALEKFKQDIRDRNSKRNLVLSFHGWTGIGKNYVSKFIAEAFYNAHISLYLAPLHLMHRPSTEKQNGSLGIQSWILGNITRCGVNVIIIDEADKAEPEYLLEIQSAIETLNHQWRKVKDGVVKMGPIAVFIFLSNSKASQINHYLFSQIANGRDRNLIRKSEFQQLLDESESEWYENFTAKSVIDYFVPFLPLTETHVKQCIERDFIKKGRDPTDLLIMNVLEELSFVDMGGKEGQVSLTGCKRVQDKVNLHIDD